MTCVSCRDLYTRILIHCCILLDFFLYGLYYDAWIQENKEMNKFISATLNWGVAQLAPTLNLKTSARSHPCHALSF